MQESGSGHVPRLRVENIRRITCCANNGNIAGYRKKCFFARCNALECLVISDTAQRHHHIFGFWQRDRKLIESRNLPIIELAGKKSAYRRGLHFFVDFYLKASCLARPVRNATANPNRRANRTMSGASKAFLAPRLTATTAYFAAILGVRPWPARHRALAIIKLFYQRPIPPKTENTIKEVRRTNLFSFCIVGVYFHIYTLRISTTLPLLPGTAPSTASKFSSESTFATFKFRTVTRSPPMRPAIRVPFKTRCGQTAPMEPGSRSECFCPCVRGPP